MSKPGFVQAHKARGKYYYYVLRAYRDQDKKVQKEYLLSLGRKQNAFDTITNWLRDPSTIPENMKKYKEDDFKNWLKYIEERE